MNILDIDAGNTRLKWRLQSKGNTKASGAIQNAAIKVMVTSLVESLDGIPVHFSRMSSVRSSEVIENICAKIKDAFGVTPRLPDPIAETPGLTVRNVNPHRLGCDRWLAMLGARALYPDQAVMIVDSGTALTLDVVGANGIFQGGLICPGLNTMLRSVTESTDLLVLPDVPKFERGLAFPSLQAIQNGSLSMAAALIEKEVERYSGSIRLLLCGGDARLLAECLTIPVEYYKDLVLDGLAVAIPAGEEKEE
ncbi:type III pantothenate kinase [Sansalvadorimonas verongulae]|uniref:type III pantothenate kinase n=1 Tax=Sansalvadorimonas verongulae TaxID=2172824 RepID=UPI0012BD6AE4|nr:type III pantothenate kinase [Sansalvadorimonas verongulae]MTI11876.1 type III pantothenate kinase [Sansalvadorimonas verongulae]